MRVSDKIYNAVFSVMDAAARVLGVVVRAATAIKAFMKRERTSE